ncbi:MAG: metallophosphoesterase [Clostridia bacterium]|nr:metallophosphoesterase [Clostridia bacterium]
MKIIHCADLHLGAKMTSKLSPAQAYKRRHEILQNFDRLAQYAKIHNVTIIIIAGDLLDTDSTDIATKDYILNVMREYPDISFVYLCGNHDQSGLLRNDKNLPPNLKNFDHTWQSISFDEDVVITGKEGALLQADYQNIKLDATKFNIVVLHGQEFVGQKQDGDIINLKSLQNKNIDYLALGHIHSYKQQKLDDRGMYAYSGCLEGRGFDECGQKGFVLLEINNKKLTTTFVPFAQREYNEIDVDISNCLSFHQILQECQNKVFGINTNNIVRINLCGTYTTQTDKSLGLLCDELSRKFFAFDIKDKTTLFIDPQEYQNDVSLVGEFLRLVKESDLDEKTKADVITQGLKILKEAK